MDSSPSSSPHSLIREDSCWYRLPTQRSVAEEVFQALPALISGTPLGIMNQCEHMINGDRSKPYQLLSSGFLLSYSLTCFSLGEEEGEEEGSI